MKDFVDIKGFEGMYQINMSGEIMGLRGRYGRAPAILKAKLGRNGYYSVSLCQKEGKRITVSIHRLLAIAFIPNPENKPQVNHIDGDKLNNKLSNLEWVSHKENLVHASNMGLLKGNRTHRILYQTDLILIREEYAIGGILQKELAKKWGISNAYMNMILHNKRRIIKCA